MTAQQLARDLRGKKIGRDKWKALCPAHPDRHPSLEISAGRRGVLIRCRSNGCSARAIVDALGLRFSDLFYDRSDPEVRVQWDLHRLAEHLQIQYESARMLGMHALEKAAWEELQLVRCRIEPLEVYREWRGRVWSLMNCSQRERYLEGVWKQLNTTRQQGRS